jgi:trigger factor
VKTTVEKLSPTRVKLAIAVTPEELKPSITHAYGHIAEDINIPGFRKGKVPPAIIDQRVGKGAVIEHAVNEGLDGFFRTALEENELRPLGRPQADIIEWPNEKDFSGDLLVNIEVDVRPEITLPTYEGLKLTVDAQEAGEADVQDELDRIRARFGTLITVDLPAKTGDFAQLDLVAKTSTPRRASPTRSAPASCSPASTRPSTRSPLVRPRPSPRPSSVASTKAKTPRSPSR